MIAWPSALPGIRFSGFSYQPAKLVQRFQVDDGGPAEQGRFTTAATAVCSFTLRCDLDQRKALLVFYEGPAAYGAAWFSFRDAVTDTDCIARFYGEEPPKFGGSSRNKMDVQITLEVKR